MIQTTAVGGRYHSPRLTMKSNRFSTHAAMHIAIPALVLIAYAVRVVFLGAEGLWRDEVDAIRFAMDPLPTVLGRFREPEFNGALYHLVLRGWLQLAGVNDFALRYLSVAFGVLLFLVSATTVLCEVPEGRISYTAGLGGASTTLMYTSLYSSMTYV